MPLIDDCHPFVRPTCGLYMDPAIKILLKHEYMLSENLKVMLKMNTPCLRRNWVVDPSFL
jgi:hypothetical protein